MAGFEKPWRDTLTDLFSKFVGPPGELTTLSPSDPHWLHSLWPGLSDPLAKPTPIPQRGTAWRYEQIETRRKHRRRAGPKIKYRKGPKHLTNATSLV